MRLWLRRADSRTRPCGGCGEPVSIDLTVPVWIKTALGTMCAHTHPGLCEGASVGRVREQPAKRIEEPMPSDEELMKR